MARGMRWDKVPREPRKRIDPDMARTCAMCDQPILGRSATDMKGYFHPKCLFEAGPPVPEVHHPRCLRPKVVFSRYGWHCYGCEEARNREEAARRLQ